MGYHPAAKNQTKNVTGSLHTSVSGTSSLHQFSKHSAGSGEHRWGADAFDVIPADERNAPIPQRAPLTATAAAVREATMQSVSRRAHDSTDWDDWSVESFHADHSSSRDSGADVDNGPECDQGTKDSDVDDDPFKIGSTACKSYSPSCSKKISITDILPSFMDDMLHQKNNQLTSSNLCEYDENYFDEGYGYGFYKNNQDSNNKELVKATACTKLRRSSIGPTANATQTLNDSQRTTQRRASLDCYGYTYNNNSNNYTSTIPSTAAFTPSNSLRTQRRASMDHTLNVGGSFGVGQTIGQAAAGLGPLRRQSLSSAYNMVSTQNLQQSEHPQQQRRRASLDQGYNNNTVGNGGSNNANQYDGMGFMTNTVLSSACLSPRYPKRSSSPIPTFDVIMCTSACSLKVPTLKSPIDDRKKKVSTGAQPIAQLSADEFSKLMDKDKFTSINNTSATKRTPEQITGQQYADRLTRSSHHRNPSLPICDELGASTGRLSTSHHQSPRSSARRTAAIGRGGKAARRSSTNASRQVQSTSSEHAKGMDTSTRSTGKVRHQRQRRRLSLDHSSNKNAPVTTDGRDHTTPHPAPTAGVADVPSPTSSQRKRVSGFRARRRSSIDHSKPSCAVPSSSSEHSQPQGLVTAPQKQQRRSSLNHRDPNRSSPSSSSEKKQGAKKTKQQRRASLNTIDHNQPEACGSSEYGHQAIATATQKQRRRASLNHVPALGPKSEHSGSKKTPSSDKQRRRMSLDQNWNPLTSFDWKVGENVTMNKFPTKTKKQQQQRRASMDYSTKPKTDYTQHTNVKNSPTGSRKKKEYSTSPVKSKSRDQHQRQGKPSQDPPGTSATSHSRCNTDKSNSVAGSVVEVDLNPYLFQKLNNNNNKGKSEFFIPEDSFNDVDLSSSLLNRLQVPKLLGDSTPSFALELEHDPSTLLLDSTTRDDDDEEVDAQDYPCKLPSAADSVVMLREQKEQDYNYNSEQRHQMRRLQNV